MSNNDITFAYFAEIIKSLDNDIMFKDFSVKTQSSDFKEITIDLDKKIILIGLK